MDTPAWIVLFVALVLPSVHVECAKLLLHSPTSVVCSGPCCLKCVQDAKESLINDKHRFPKNLDICTGSECSVDYEAEYALDNNFETSWNLSVIYSDAVSAGLTLDLGQVSSIQNTAFSVI